MPSGASGCRDHKNGAFPTLLSRAQHRDKQGQGRKLSPPLAVLKVYPLDQQAPQGAAKQ